MKKKNVRRSSNSNINSHYSKTAAYLTRADKQAKKIATEEGEIKKLINNKASSYLLKLHDYKLSKLKAELNRLLAVSGKHEHKFGSAISKNDSLNKKKDNSSPQKGKSNSSSKKGKGNSSSKNEEDK